MSAPRAQAGVLAGQVALVTGAGRGIGQAIALELAAAGAAVAIAARSATELDAVQAEIEAIGGQARVIAGDLLEPDNVVGAVEQAAQWHQRLDIVVNAAGTIRRAPELETSYADWDATFDLNVRTTYFVCQEAARYVLAQSDESATASFVNLTSLAGVAVTGTNAAYAASKAALIQMTRVLAARWSPRIRVNAVGPGYVETDFNRDWFAQPGNREYVLGHTPMKRLATPADVAQAIGFLVSPNGGYFTGQHLLLDGGWTCAP